MPAHRLYSPKAIITAARSGLTDEQVAAQIGCSRTYVAHLRRACGVPASRPSPAWSAAEVARLLAMLRAGEPQPAIAAAIGRTMAAIRLKVHSLGWGREFFRYAAAERVRSVVWGMTRQGATANQIAVVVCRTPKRVRSIRAEMPAWWAKETKQRAV